MVPGIRTCDVRGIELGYETFGSPQDPAVLLIQGLGMQMLGWDEQFRQTLAAGGRFVVRFDSRDVGLSTHLTAAGTPDLLRLLVGADVSVPCTIEDMAADAVGLLDALDIPAAHLVGASMGG